MRRFSSLLHRYGCVTEAVRRGYRALCVLYPVRACADLVSVYRGSMCRTRPLRRGGG